MTHGGTDAGGGGTIEVPPGLAGVGDELRASARSLRAGRGDLAARPDAGRSSDEVATALAALAGAVDGLAGQLDDVAAATVSAHGDLTGTDHAVGGALQPVGPVGPVGVTP